MPACGLWGRTELYAFNKQLVITILIENSKTKGML